jgi:hypothetical protein
VLVVKLEKGASHVDAEVVLAMVLLIDIYR